MSIVTTTCGRSPPILARSREVSHWRQISPSASARRWVGVRASGPADDRVSAWICARTAVIKLCPSSGSSSPCTRVMPPAFGQSSRRRRSWRRSSSSSARSRSAAVHQASVVARSSVSPIVRGAASRAVPDRPKASGAASWTEARTRTADPDTSPSPNARATAGICSSARARSTTDSAELRDMPCRWASHADAERCPSTAKALRRSNSTTRRPRSASSTRQARSSSSRSDASASSESAARCGTATRRGQIEGNSHDQGYRTCVRIICEARHTPVEVRPSDGRRCRSRGRRPRVIRSPGSPGRSGSRRSPRASWRTARTTAGTGRRRRGTRS